MSDYKCPVCGETEKLTDGGVLVSTNGSETVAGKMCHHCQCFGEAESFKISKPKRNQEAKAGFSLNELAKEIHENAIKHGWWEEERRFGEIIALCHSELSEALEEYRNNRPNMYFLADTIGTGRLAIQTVETDIDKWKGEKLEGIGIELADCIIRIFDYCAYAKIDIEKAILLKHEYNKTRPYKHGGKVI